MIARSEQGRPRWVAALLMGLLLILALLIASWFLRTCAPVEPSTSVAVWQAEAPPEPEPPPDPTPLLRASLDHAEADGRRLATELAALEADARRRLAQCKAPEPAKPVEPPRPPPAAKPPPPLPADRWARKDLGLLQGCWRLGKDTRGSIGLSRGSETCDVKAGRICFGADGAGERQTSAVCPSTGTITCTAPITARFGSDSTLGTTQPAVPCRPAVAHWNGPPNGLTCRRVSDTLALCRDRLNFEYEFRRD